MTVTARSLERRILFAMLGATALAVPIVACRKEAQPAPLAAGKTNDASIGPPASVQSKFCRSDYEKEEEMCIEPFSPHPRAEGTGEPAPAPAKALYDADGCLPKNEVSTGCCNPGMDGPRKKDGKCCYTVCTGACCGRPFLVHGQPRVATVSFDRASAWAADLPAVTLDEATANALGHAWLRDAQMEHASAAAFGRFMLQLLSLGAPADLVRRAALAAADEVHHAELCFTLAARYLGIAPSPERLALDDALDSRSLPAIVKEVIAEGCIGETIAALLAARQLEGARDNEVAAALTRIAEDEAKHAELAWAFVRWAIDIGGDDVRSAARKAFQVTPFAWPADTIESAAWRAHGRLTKSETAQVIEDAMSLVIAPCAASLFESVPELHVIEEKLVRGHSAA